MNRILCAVGLVVLVFLPASAQIPEKINWQGYLTDAGGPLNGPVNLSLRLYSAATGGTLRYQKDTTDVIADNGVVNVPLGPFSTGTFEGPLFVAVHVNGGKELQPRSPLTSVPYAHSALSVAGLNLSRVETATFKGVNVVANSQDNAVPTTVAGATLFGGGWRYEGLWGYYPNSISGDFAAIGGGLGNQASAAYATVSGGSGNSAGATRTTVGGGYGNAATTINATVAGGEANTARGDGAAIGGGRDNLTRGDYAVIAGGGDSYSDDNGLAEGNRVYKDYGAIGGGSGNVIGTNDNDFTLSQFVTIGGGFRNNAFGSYSTIGGGRGNGADGPYGAVGGGYANAADGSYATVPGGYSNTADGSYSLAAGQRAKALHSGAFVWGDATSANFSSTANNQFLIRASGGVGIGTNNPITAMHVVRSVDGPASEQNHVALIDNTSTGTSADVLALRVGRTTAPGTSNAFISFRYGASPYGLGYITGTGDGGVVLTSLGADYAEYLPHLDMAESLEPGDVVGVFAGQVSRKTTGADQVLVVSTAPIVLGNLPGTGEGDAPGHAKIAFLGQAPVRVRGPVDVGAFLLPSGNDDGTAVAVAPDEIRPDQLALVFGTAWDSKSGAGVGLVNAAIGIDQSAAAARVITALHDQLASMRADVSSLIERLERLEARTVN